MSACLTEHQFIDQTTSPSASASFRQRAAKASTTSRTNVSDDRDTPLVGRGGESCKFDLGRGQSEIFLRDWTTQIRLNPLKKLEFRRMRFFASRAGRAKRRRAKLN